MLEKEASAYYDQEPDPEEFDDLEYEGDLDLPVDFADTDQLMSLVNPGSAVNRWPRATTGSGNR